MFAHDIAITVFLLLAALVAGLANKFSRWYISMPMVFVATGILFGPLVTGLVIIEPDTEAVQIVAELTLALILFADASTLDLRKIGDDVYLPGRLLLIALPLIILLGGLVGKLLFPSIPISYMLLAGAILAPTDASLGLPLFTNKRVPVRIRRALNVESGLNDGIVSPFVVLFLGLTLSEEGMILDTWLTEALRELALAVLVGIVVGYVAGAFLQTAVARKWTTRMYANLAILAVALSCFFLSIAVDGNGFVAAFVGGLLFGHATRRQLADETEFTEGAGTLLSLLLWTVSAAIFVTPQLGDLVVNWRAILYACLSLTIVRMLPVALSMIGTGLRRDTVLLMGWFGPRGLASVVFGLLAVGAMEEAGQIVEPLATLVILTILISVFLHGVTARPLANWYAKRLEAAEAAHVELVEMPEIPVRPRLLAGFYAANNIEDEATKQT